MTGQRPAINESARLRLRAALSLIPAARDFVAHVPAVTPYFTKAAETPDEKFVALCRALRYWDRAVPDR